MKLILTILTVTIVCFYNSYSQCPTNKTINDKNLIKNGHFNKGTSSFESDYVFNRYFFEVDRLTSGQYSIMINPFYANPDYKACYGWDKIDNPMMLISGGSEQEKNIWKQKVEVDSDKEYVISFFVSSLISLGQNFELDVMINDELLESVEHAVSEACNWKQYTFIWKSDVKSEVELRLVNQYKYDNGNDFAIDDIEMYACEGRTADGFAALLASSFKLEAKEVILVENTNDNKGKSIEELIVIHEEGKLSEIPLNNIEFEFGKSTLKEVSFKELNDLASALLIKKRESVEIEISGHTDNIGSEASNLLLSKERAKSVAKYLYKKGVLPSRIKHEGYGATRPIASNETEEGRRQNRRVEFKIID